MEKKNLRKELEEMSQAVYDAIPKQRIDAFIKDVERYAKEGCGGVRLDRNTPKATLDYARSEGFDVVEHKGWLHHYFHIIWNENLMIKHDIDFQCYDF